MKQFISVKDVADPNSLVDEALRLKQAPFSFSELGKHRTLGLIFLNPSLRTRMSTQKAAQNLGLNVMVLNIDQEGWALETREGVKMNGTKVEHIKDAAGVMGQYCDILGIRSFASLKSKEEDEKEEVLRGLIKYSGVPVVSLESAFLHPLQSLADLVTIREEQKTAKPKISLLWAPHVKPLPQAVANSFSEWVLAAGHELTIGFPEGYELSPAYVNGARMVHSKEEAIEGADFVYVKNWSQYQNYGKLSTGLDGWMLDGKDLTSNPRMSVMHCLPVRRDVELSSAVLDSDQSLVLKQANNRTYSAQTVLKRILENL